MKATPRPWEYGKAKNYEGFYIAPQSTLPTLAAVERCGQNIQVTCFNFPDSTEENTRLIVAAVNAWDSEDDLMARILQLRHEAK